MALLICSLKKPNFFLFQKNSVDPQGLVSCKLIDKKQAQLRNRRELMGATKAASQKQSMFHRVSKANAFSIVMGIYLAFNTRIVQLGPNWDGPPLGNSSARSDFENHVSFSTPLRFSHENRREWLQKMASAAMARSSFRAGLCTLSSIF